MPPTLTAQASIALLMLGNVNALYYEGVLQGTVGV